METTVGSPSSDQRDGDHDQQGEQPIEGRQRHKQTEPDQRAGSEPAPSQRGPRAEQDGGQDHYVESPDSSVDQGQVVEGEDSDGEDTQPGRLAG